MLNTGKGPAVRSPRAQADKKQYQFLMKKRLEEQVNLFIRQEMIDRIYVKDGRVEKVIGKSGINTTQKLSL